MTLALVASLFLAAIASVALAGLYLLWPRRLTAEEWVSRSTIRWGGEG